MNMFVNPDLSRLRMHSWGVAVDEPRYALGLNQSIFGDRHAEAIAGFWNEEEGRIEQHDEGLLKTLEAITGAGSSDYGYTSVYTNDGEAKAISYFCYSEFQANLMSSLVPPTTVINGEGGRRTLIYKMDGTTADIEALRRLIDSDERLSNTSDWFPVIVKTARLETGCRLALARGVAGPTYTPAAMTKLLGNAPRRIETVASRILLNSFGAGPITLCNPGSGATRAFDSAEDAAAFADANPDMAFVKLSSGRLSGRQLGYAAVIDRRQHHLRATGWHASSFDVHSPYTVHRVFMDRPVGSGEQPSTHYAIVDHVPLPIGQYWMDPAMLKRLRSWGTSSEHEWPTYWEMPFYRIWDVYGHD